jgi:hypothetical protein
MNKSQKKREIFHSLNFRQSIKVKESLSPTKSLPKRKDRASDLSLNPVDSLKELTRSQVLQSSQRCLPNESHSNTQASADLLRPLDLSATGIQRREPKLELAYSRRRPVVPGSVVAKSLRLQQQ